MPERWDKASKNMKEYYLDKYYEYRNATKGPGALHKNKKNVDEILRFILGVHPETCKRQVILIK